MKLIANLITTSFTLFFLILPPFNSASLADQPFVIKVVDSENDWPVPLVKLKTTSNVEFVTDNAGVVAFDLPEFMGRETWLHLDGDGYEVKKDGFGYRGIRVTPKPGETITIKVSRTILAKRLGRVTGSGLFAESQKAGLHKDWIDQGITGCDTVQVASHNGKLHWVWGDTNLPRYPLGLFHTLSATTKLKPLESFEPPIKLRFEYFTDDNNNPRNTAEMPGEGPTWLSGLTSLPDKEGNMRLVASYVKTKKLVVHENGLCVWDEKTKQFEQVEGSAKPVSGAKESMPTQPEGHAIPWVDERGEKWVMFGDPFVVFKFKESFEGWKNHKGFQTREHDKKLKSIDGQEITAHRGSIAWSEKRNKYICVFCETGGKPSHLGEIWFTEADDPANGKWSAPIKILSHKNYSFYNPRVQSELTPDDADFILFEGTYTNMFSNNAVPTPRYNYNQILYRLDFADVDRAIGKLESRSK